MKKTDQLTPRARLTVLIVDDDYAVRDSLSGYLESTGWHTAMAETAEKGLELVKSGEGDIVITDVRMPGMNGIELTSKIKEFDPDIEVLIATGHSDESLVIDALKVGAFDYFRKPINAKEVAVSLERTRRFRELKLENKRLKALVERYTKVDDRHSFIGQSPATQALMSQIEKVAASPNTTVLLTGESGVGKEVAARLIHKISRPPSAPFIAVNCGGIAETLLEAELFGREKGAYTGADKMVPGVFELGAGGTVLLDEISEMSSQAQSRFLRVLEDSCIRRLGGTKELVIDNTRIIAATNRDLKKRVADGKFREDLYFRVMVAPIHIPPLRKRTTDILPLAKYFLDIVNKRNEIGFYFSKQAEVALMQYDFPGNTRELRNMVERGTVFAATSEINPPDLGIDTVATDSAQATSASSTGQSVLSDNLDLAANEGNLVRTAISLNPSNHSAAARALGITTQALYRKIEKFQLK